MFQIASISKARAWRREGANVKDKGNNTDRAKKRYLASAADKAAEASIVRMKPKEKSTILQQDDMS